MFQKKYIGSFQPEADPCPPAGAAPSAEISRFLSEAKGSYIGIAFNNLGQ